MCYLLCPVAATLASIFRMDWIFTSYCLANPQAEHIMENERGRFPPPKQAIFAKFYTAEERKVDYTTLHPRYRQPAP